MAVGATLLCLSGWMVLSYISARTPFYPIIKGNLRSDFGVFGKVKFAEEVRWALANLLSWKPIQTIPLLFVAGFALPSSRTNRAVHALMFASVAAFALMMHFFQTFHDADSINRYYFSFTVAFGLAVTLKALSQAASTRSAAFLGGAMVAVAVGVEVLNAKDSILSLYSGRISAVEELIKQRGPAHVYNEADDLYRRIQESVPPKERLLVMLDHTYLLDGRRNEILNYDHPGAMGPKPGVPCFRGPEPWASYMLSLGIRYVAYQLGSSSLEYQRSTWTQRLAIVVPESGRGGFYKNQARFELDAFDVLEALTVTRKVVFHEGDIWVLDLSSRN
jgi:hypothetical protein